MNKLIKIYLICYLNELVNAKFWKKKNKKWDVHEKIPKQQVDTPINQKFPSDSLSEFSLPPKRLQEEIISKERSQIPNTEGLIATKKPKHRKTSVLPDKIKENQSNQFSKMPMASSRKIGKKLYLNQPVLEPQNLPKQKLDLMPTSRGLIATPKAKNSNHRIPELLPKIKSKIPPKSNIKIRDKKSKSSNTILPQLSDKTPVTSQSKPAPSMISIKNQKPKNSNTIIPEISQKKPSLSTKGLISIDKKKEKSQPSTESITKPLKTKIEKPPPMLNLPSTDFKIPKIKIPKTKIPKH